MATAEAQLPAARPLNLATQFVMLIGGLMTGTAMSALTPVLPKIETALAHSADEQFLVKMLVPIMGVTMVIGAPLTGILVDRLGLRPVILFNSILYALAGTAGLYVGDLETLLASRLIVGLAAAGLATISMTVISARLEGAERAKWMGFHISTAMFGALLIQPIVGTLGELGWRWPFAVHAVSLFIVVAVFSGLQEPRKIKPTGAADKAADAIRNPLKWFPLWYLPLALVIGSITYLPGVYLGFQLRDVGISSPTIISMVMLADALLGATMALLFGWSQRRISSNTAFIVSFTCTGVGMLIVSLAGSYVAIIAGMLVFGLGIGWFVPNMMTSLGARVTQAQQGRAIGIVKAAHFISSPLAVTAVEPIARAVGPSGAAMSGAALSFGALVVFLLIGTKLVRRGSPAATRPAAVG